MRRPVAVSVLTFMLALAGKLMIKDRLTRAGPPAGPALDHMGVGLIGRTLGLLGIGNIGAEVFRLAAPLRHALHRPRPVRRHGGRRPSSASSWSSSTSCSAGPTSLSVSCPLTPETHHIVNAERLALMKPTAYLINTARGPIVDQEALTDGAAERPIAGAGLDVFEQEPPARTTRS